MLFPAFDLITGNQSLMSRNIEQHEAFNPGLNKLSEYVKLCRREDEPVPFDAVQFRQIIDSFGGVFTTHLADEITTLIGLETSSETAALKKAFLEFDMKMREGDKVC